MKSKIIFLLIVTFYCSITDNKLFGQVPYLVKNIRDGSASSTPYSLINIGGMLYFSANNGTEGRELWKSDGTDAGTVMVKDINVGIENSMVTSVLQSDYMTDFNGTLFFTANNASYGMELWKSDGTDAGTVMVKDINIGATGSAPQNLIVVNGVLFFEANDGVYGKELWKSDGTELGTVRVSDINPGTGNAFGTYTYNNGYLTNFNGTLFFQATNGTSGEELWKSDGTSIGTVMVKEISSGSGNSSPQKLTVVGNKLFFIASTGSNVNWELYVSDGSELGTGLVVDMYTGGESSYPNNLTNFNGELYFSANNGSTGIELWKSDGTELGTVPVSDIYPGASGSSLSDFLVVGNALYFSANNGQVGQELWKSDGTDLGTVLVKNIASSTYNSFPTYLATINSALYFSASSDYPALWTSDGTDSGTTLLGSSNPKYLTNVDGTLFFQGDSSNEGFELWALYVTAEINELKQNRVSVYPNPFNDQIVITLDNKLSSVVTITDIIGKEVFSDKYNQNVITLDVKTLSSGQYIVTVSNTNSVMTKKMVK